MSLSNAQIKFWGFEELTSKGQSEPANPVDFYELVLVEIGPREQPGAEWFDFIVCTPAALTHRISERDGFLFARYHLVIERWDRDVIQGALQALCDSAPESDWENVAQYLSRFGFWEYEPFRHGPRRSSDGRKLLTEQ